MAKTLYKYEASSNKFVWFTTWDRALRNYYTDDYNYVPDPVVGNPYNTFVEFRSRKPGMANVDWCSPGHSRTDPAHGRKRTFHQPSGQLLRRELLLAWQRAGTPHRLSFRLCR